MGETYVAELALEPEAFDELIAEPVPLADVVEIALPVPVVLALQLWTKLMCQFR